MGDTLRFAQQLPLTAPRPRGDLSSTPAESAGGEIRFRDKSPTTTLLQVLIER